MLLVFPCGRTPIRVTLPINHLPWGASDSQSLWELGMAFWDLPVGRENALCSEQLLALGQDPLGEA